MKLNCRRQPLTITTCTLCKKEWESHSDAEWFKCGYLTHLIEDLHYTVDQAYANLEANKKAAAKVDILSITGL